MKEQQERIDRKKLELLNFGIKTHNLAWLSFPVYLIGLTLFGLGIKYFYWSPTSWIMVPIGLILWVPMLCCIIFELSLYEDIDRNKNQPYEATKMSHICEMLWTSRPRCLESYYKKKWQNWVDHHVPDYRNYLEIERTNLPSN